MQEAKEHTLSYLDGVKITFAPHEWVLMIPDDHEDLVHLYVQAVDYEKGEAYRKVYSEKIQSWIADAA
jgi:phosphomannomutase